MTEDEEAAKRVRRLYYSNDRTIKALVWIGVIFLWFWVLFSWWSDVTQPWRELKQGLTKTWTEFEQDIEKGWTELQRRSAEKTRKQ
jgi:hypothetical protein